MDSISVLSAFLPSTKGHVPTLMLRKENLKSGDTKPSKKQSHLLLLCYTQLTADKERIASVNSLSAQRLHGIISMWAPSVEQGSLPLGCANSSVLQSLAPSRVQLQVPKALTRVKQDGMLL